jgi:hypothetical protein
MTRYRSHASIMLVTDPGRKGNVSVTEPASLPGNRQTSEKDGRDGCEDWYGAAMATVKAAAVQAAYHLMDREACLAKAVDLLGKAAAAGAGIVVFPEVFIPGTRASTGS